MGEMEGKGEGEQTFWMKSEDGMRCLVETDL